MTSAPRPVTGARHHLTSHPITGETVAHLLHEPPAPAPVHRPVFVPGAHFIFIKSFINYKFCLFILPTFAPTRPPTRQQPRGPIGTYFSIVFTSNLHPFGVTSKVHHNPSHLQCWLVSKSDISTRPAIFEIGSIRIAGDDIILHGLSL